MDLSFGPPSEPIDIAAFLESATDLPPHREHYLPQQSDVIAADCNVSDIRDSLSASWNNPILSAYLSRIRNKSAAAAHSRGIKAKKKALSTASESPIVGDAPALHISLDAIKLNSWRLPEKASYFVRSSKIADHNALTEVKLGGTSSAVSGGLKAIITVTVYNKVSWSAGALTRASQHVLLSSQTLGDLIDIIPCLTARNFSKTNEQADHEAAGDTNNGCVICIENVAYGDGKSAVDYASKLLTHLQAFSRDSPITKAAKPICETPFSSLSLRIGQPYWLLHRGNCEHFIVVDQIRLQHPNDIESRYPLTTQMTPPRLDLCRACGKVPAVLSVVNDARLGESPCLMCSPCWRQMGDPPDPRVSTTAL